MAARPGATRLKVPWVMAGCEGSEALWRREERQLCLRLKVLPRDAHITSIIARTQSDLSSFFVLDVKLSPGELLSVLTWLLKRCGSDMISQAQRCGDRLHSVGRVGEPVHRCGRFLKKGNRI